MEFEKEKLCIRCKLFKGASQFWSSACRRQTQCRQCGLWCTRCRKLKTVEKFNRNKKSGTGRQIYCKPCNRRINRGYKGSYRPKAPSPQKSESPLYFISADMFSTKTLGLPDLQELKSQSIQDIQSVSILVGHVHTYTVSPATSWVEELPLDTQTPFNFWNKCV